MKKFITTSALLLSTLTTVAYADIQTDTIDELWGKPTLVYGGGLTDQQVQQVNKDLNVNLDNVNRQVVTGEDVDKYLGTSGVATNSLFSSVLVKKDNSSGVIVDIKTPDNITKITATQYANAAITAGASNVKIDVVSPIKVTGESALTGVYVALQANGEKIDQERTEVAQQELETVNEIANAQESNKAFDSAALDVAVSDIKLKLAEYNGKASSAQVEDVINKALASNGLEGVLTPEQVSQLVAFAKTYQQTSAIDSKEVAEQLQQFKDTASKYITDIFNDQQTQSLLDKVGHFFESLWKTISNFFS